MERIPDRPDAECHQRIPCMAIFTYILVDFYGKIFECKYDIYRIYHTWILWVMGLFCWDYALVDAVTPRSEGRRALSLGGCEMFTDPWKRNIMWTKPFSWMSRDGS